MGNEVGAFTICSNNYLGQAMALKRSLLSHNQQMRFWIILVDELSDQVNYSDFAPAEVISVSSIPNIDLEDLIARYYIIELNTSVKPSVFKYLKNKHPELELLYYLDPDLYFYNSLSECNSILKENSLVLTPHILSPIQRDGLLPDENVFLQFGIYNLGFAGMNLKHKEIEGILDWWEERVIKFGYDKANKGYFVDQLWMAHAPLFFEGVQILTTYNYNMAPWNLHERDIKSIDGNTILLNDNSELVFYHFSKITSDEIKISREFNRYNLTDFPLLLSLYQEYYKELERCEFNKYRSIPIAFQVKPSPSAKTNNPTEKRSPKRKNLLSRFFLKLSKIFDSN